MIQLPISLAPGCSIPSRHLCRHIGIFGATGTGKTSTARRIVQGLACPVVMLDAKGDLATMGGEARPQLSLSGMGSDLLGRALDLSPAQCGALEMVLAWAEDTRRPLHDLEDLWGLLGEATPASLRPWGYVTPISLGAIQRATLRLRRRAAWAFGPAVLQPWNMTGRAVVHCSAMVENPGLYGAFAADLLLRLYRSLGELGDPGAPGLALFIDEAHLLFHTLPPALEGEISRVVRLIRSKGVALIWATQSPTDLPESILSQIGTRIQHGLRASSVGGQGAARAAAETMGRGVSEVLGLGIGEALVSVAGAKADRIQIQHEVTR